MFKKFYFINLLLLLSVFYTPAFAGSLATDHQKIIQTKKFFLSQSWLSLNHYSKKNNKFISTISDPDFFISENGFDNPKEEFFSLYEKLWTDHGQINGQFFCAHIARATYILSSLKLPSPTCHDYEKWKLKYTGDSVYIDFPASYIESPSSVFGHTFLRLQKQDQPSPVSYAVDYTAHLPPKQSFTDYIINGLTGGYKGYFSIKPYYVKSWQYLDKENRAIWQYQLKMSDAQRERLYQHLWEIKDHYIHYYFVQENCSYQVLKILKAAIPDLNIDSSDYFTMGTFPIDTIRLLNDSGLILNQNYESTTIKRILEQFEKLPAAQKQLIEQSLDSNNHERILALAKLNKDLRSLLFNIASYNLLHAKTNASVKIAQNLQASLLQLDLPQPIIEPEAKVDIENFHNTHRFGLGLHHNQENILTLSFRHSYHDFSDLLGNYSAGIETAFFDLQLAIDEKKVELSRMTLLRLTSIQANSFLEKPVSWQFDLSAEKLLSDPDRYLTKLHFVAGKAASTDIGVVYIMPGLNLNHISETEPYFSVGSGIYIGLLKQTPSDTFQMEASYLDTGSYLYKAQLQAEYSFSISRNSIINLKINRSRESGLYHSTSQLQIAWYF